MLISRYTALVSVGALALAQKGDVVITASEGFGHSAVFGDNTAIMAKNKGVAGVGNLNAQLQAALNPATAGHPRALRGPGGEFREGRSGLERVPGGIGGDEGSQSSQGGFGPWFQRGFSTRAPGSRASGEPAPGGGLCGRCVGLWRPAWRVSQAGRSQRTE